MSYTNTTLRPQSTMPQYNNFNYQPQVTQPIFPQPSGNVYFVNNNLEVANIPIGAGMSAVLCLPENLLYIKTMQNNMPMILGYKLSPLEPPAPVSKEEETPTNTDAAAPTPEINWEDRLKTITDSYEQKIKTLEQTVQELNEKVGGLLKCQF